jgi:hypothetical protein
MCPKHKGNLLFTFFATHFYAGKQENVMENFFSKEVMTELAQSQTLKNQRKTRLRVGFDSKRFPITRLWDTGFALDSENAPKLRGLVDLYDGTRHVAQCLIVASEFDEHEARFDFKRNTEATGHAPVDYVVDPQTPVAYLT